MNITYLVICRKGGKQSSAAITGDGRKTLWIAASPRLLAMTTVDPVSTLLVILSDLANGHKMTSAFGEKFLVRLVSLRLTKLTLLTGFSEEIRLNRSWAAMNRFGGGSAAASRGAGENIDLQIGHLVFLSHTGNCRKAGRYLVDRGGCGCNCGKE